jgi:hypothetical protein
LAGGQLVEFVERGFSLPLGDADLAGHISDHYASMPSSTSQTPANIEQDEGLPRQVQGRLGLKSKLNL